MKTSQELTFNDLSTEEGILTTVDVNTLRPMPVDYQTYPWKVITDAQKQQFCCLLDDINVLLIPVPQTKAEEEELVNRFLDGVRKLFTPENNWTCLAMLDTTMDYCAQCNSCSAACHLYEMSGEHEMYRPNFRSELFRRIYKQYVKKEPLAKWRYGDTELTYLIPNQIAINRMVTASVWAVMVMGMPLMVVNNEVVPQPITNDPGQIIRVNGTAEDVASAVRYVTPPSFSPNYDNSVNSLISNTMTQSGANDAALGDMKPDNTSAIIALREAASVPMQTYQNAFYSFIEDVARIWAEFWVCLYGKRSLKMTSGDQTWYFPFDGDRYRDLVLSVRVDVGASTLWSESQSIQTLDNLLAAQIISPEQYLERLPKGIIPDLNGLIKDMQKARELAEQQAAMQAAQSQAAAEAQAAGQQATEAQAAPVSNAEALLSQLPPEMQAQFASLSPEQQQAVLQKAGVSV